MRPVKIFLWALIAFSAVGCRQGDIDVTSQQQYEGIVGHVFETKGDFILFKFSERHTEIHVEEPGTTDIPALSQIPSKFPFEYRSNYIVGVLPKGSRFQVFAVKRRQDSVGGVRYKAHLLKGPDQFKGVEMDSTWLTTIGGLVPTFESHLVVEVSTPTAK